MRKMLAAVVVAMSVATACTSDLSVGNALPGTTAAPSNAVAPSFTSTTTSTTSPSGDRGPVHVARGSWDVGLVHTSIVMEVLESQGFETQEVTYDNGRQEGVEPERAFLVLARGDAQLFANSWSGNHHWLTTTDASRFEGEVEDHVTVLDPIVPHGGIQGWLISKSWADAAEIGSLDQIANDPSLIAALDADGDGKGEIYGCPEDWACDDVIRSYIWLNEWNEVLEQVIEPEREIPGLEAQRGSSLYGAMFEEFLDRVERGEAAIAYVWTPTAYHSKADVGDTTVWLSLSNNAVLRGARDPSDSDPIPEIVREDGGIGFTELPSDLCTLGPDGCQTGWDARDISIVGNTSWLDKHPEVVAVLNAIEFDRREISDFAVELESLSLTEWDDKVEASRTIARNWIDANPERVATWLNAAH